MDSNHLSTLPVCNLNNRTCTTNKSVAPTIVWAIALLPADLKGGHSSVSFYHRPSYLSISFKLNLVSAETFFFVVDSFILKNILEDFRDFKKNTD